MGHLSPCHGKDHLQMVKIEIYFRETILLHNESSSRERRRTKCAGFAAASLAWPSELASLLRSGAARKSTVQRAPTTPARNHLSPRQLWLEKNSSPSPART